MKESTSQFLFFIYYIISRPFIKTYRFLIKLIKRPNNMIRFLIVFGIIVVFRYNFISIIKSLNPIIDIFTYVTLSLLMLMYLWKHANTYFGETWKKEWKDKYGWRHNK